MGLKDIFTMIKADRYTADGCEEIKKAQEAIAKDAGLPDGTMRHRKEGDKYVKIGPGSGGAGKAPANKPDKVGDFMKAYERGDFGKYQQNAEQKKAESFFKEKGTKSKNAESKPAEKPKVKLGEGANNYVFKDLANMSDEDKVFRALVVELDESFGDRDGDPDGVESWAEGWKDNAVYEGGIGFKTSHSSEEPDAVVSGDDVKAIIEKNPKRWNRIIKNAKQFYSGNGHSGNFESDVYYPEDAAPRQLTGDCKVRIRKA